MFTALALLATSLHATGREGDARPLIDPMRPISEITRNSFTLQYYTGNPVPTKVWVSEREIPLAAFRPGTTLEERDRQIEWKVYTAGGGPKTSHEIKIDGLKPGKRYYYRVTEPGFVPTDTEKRWGAADGVRREYAVSTLAPKGNKTIIRLPIKVLLMPNVINVASAHDANGAVAPLPPKMGPQEIQKIKEEYAVSARFFWVNSGMRLWVDYQFFVDDRWQRWGEQPQNADAFYKEWPASRSYSGKDYDPPGGGAFTILDTKNPLKVTTTPVVEEKPYSGQVEMAWVRKWNPTEKKWEFYNSGGGTYGIDEFPAGFPGRSQFLGGGDAAWLATHEVHHNLESHGSFALSNREDERIVFNHYTARRRVQKPDGTFDEVGWTTSGRHGEHWDGMAFWDRSLSDAQWLRMYFGYTEVVRDHDEDGFPDDDPRLPLDERRFGSDARKKMTDGMLSDLDKVMLSTWVPGPLQPSWIKPPFQGIKPNPTTPDTDNDGIPDAHDPYPLYAWKPFIYPLAATIDGDPAEWRTVPLAGETTRENMRLQFRQGHDEQGFYGLLTISGPWKRLHAVFDGEGLGVYSGVGVQGFELVRESTEGSPVKVNPHFGAPKGLQWKASQAGETLQFEFKWPNRGEGIWFWTGGGREIGTILNLTHESGRIYSVYEPYRFFYARMLEAPGKRSGG